MQAVVLAAGEGTRMRSATPKVLHPLCGRPMLLHVLDALGGLTLDRVVVVVGHGASEVAAVLDAAPTKVPVELAVQERRLGTGDAVAVALRASAEYAELDDDVLVVVGDCPLLRTETLAALVRGHRLADAAASLLTMRLDDPTGYGRIVRGPDGRVDRIVEQGDASPDERAIDEVNPSIYCFRRSLLAPALRRLTPDNDKGEYYLTDVIAVLRAAGHPVLAVDAPDPSEALGVNDREQLASAEAQLRARINGAWMRAGVTMRDPARTYIDVGVELAADVTLLPDTILSGATSVAPGSVIGPETQLVDTVVGRDAEVRQTVARGAVIGDRATVGPYVSLRPGTRLAEGAHVGTFVELKNAEIGEGAKVPHLSYVGDAEVGAGANIGAGNITANYDGRTKHRTRIGRGVHTGSNTVMVAPVELGDDAYTGAGSVITHDVPAGALAKGVPATVEEGWVARREAARDAAARDDEDADGAVGRPGEES
jgi:bifunctional UDP-N-acetylglucosamine pyrophosphorylase/glucosamine-1-phosphate N-acetyltransferase